MPSTNPARGMRDFLPADVRKREYVIGIIKEVYESYGFEPLETPAVENLETLTGKYGEEGNQLIYKILKRGEKLAENLKSEISDSKSLSDLALRYDLTVPLARVVANQKNALPKFFKRYQIQPVWRADRPARGRYREFYQCDVDTIGSESPIVEAEQILAVTGVLKRLGFDKFAVRINDRRLLTSMLTVCGVPKRVQNDSLVALDKRDKVGSIGLVDELMERGVSPKSVRALFDFLLQTTNLGIEQIKGEVAAYQEGTRLLKNASTVEEILSIDRYVQASQQGNRMLLERVSGFIAKDELGIAAVERVKAVLALLRASPQNPTVRFDITLARGLSYYTGTIVEIESPELSSSLGGGGRYDGLIGMFGKERIPACGFSLGLERILVVMEERGMFPPEIADSTPADVLVTIWSEETIADSLKLAAELRTAGLRVTGYPEPDKLGKQLKYADSINVPYVCVLGETEIAEGTVTVKNLGTGEQQSVSRADAALTIKP